MNREFFVKALIPSPDSLGTYTIYLFDPQSKILIPIVTNGWGCESILLAKRGGRILPRPHIHNTLRRTILALNAKLKSVLIYKVVNDVFYCYLKIQTKDNRILEIDCKSTDGISMAYRFNAPIYVSKEVFSNVGIVITKELLEESINGDF